MPSDVVRFLSLDEALAIHERLIATFGGPPGVRDLGMLESALFRPQTGYYKDLPAMSSALFESLLMNHPFIDGNKRAAFFMTDVFLRMNAYWMKVEAHEAHAFIVGLLDKHEVSYEVLEAWVRSHLQGL